MNRQYVPCMITHEQAESILSRRHPILRTRVRPTSVELLYIPHYLFSVSFAGGRSASDQLVVDAVIGQFAYFRGRRFDPMPVHPSDQIAFKLDVQQAQERGIAAYKRALLQAGLKNGAGYEIQRVALQQEIYIPFWVGYFERKGKIRLAIIDAIRGELQGPKIRQIILEAFHLA